MNRVFMKYISFILIDREIDIIDVLVSYSNSIVINLNNLCVHIFLYENSGRQWAGQSLQP